MIVVKHILHPIKYIPQPLNDAGVHLGDHPFYNCGNHWLKKIQKCALEVKVL